MTRDQVMALPLTMSHTQAANILGCGRGSVAAHRWRHAQGIGALKDRKRLQAPSYHRAAAKQYAILGLMGDGRIRNAMDIHRDLPTLSINTIRWALGYFAVQGLLARISVGLYQDQSE